MTKEQLEQRVAELEKEVAELKGQLEKRPRHIFHDSDGNVYDEIGPNVKKILYLNHNS